MLVRASQISLPTVTSTERNITIMTAHYLSFILLIFVTLYYYISICIIRARHVACMGCKRGRLRLKRDGTCAETGFCLSAKRTSPFKSAGASVQSTAGSRVVRISGSNVGYTMFRGSVTSTANPLHSPVSPSLPLSCVTV